MPKLGTLVGGRYELKEELLTCRFSSLFKAVDRESKKEFLARAFNEKQADSSAQAADLKDQMRLEKNILHNLSHRSIPRAIELIEESGHMYILMDYVDGTSAAKYLATLGGTAQEHVLLRYLNQLISVIGFFHDQSPPIVHGGISPETVLVDRFGAITLAEFGFMKIGSKERSKTNLRSLASQVYAAPEQLKGEGADPRNDIYSIGAFLYFMATGKHPRKSLERFKNPKQDKGLREINPSISEDLASLIEKMLSPAKEDRYNNIIELNDDVTAKFPINVEMPVSMPNLMQSIPEEGSHDAGSAVFSMSPEKAAAAMAPSKRVDLDLTGPEDEAGVSEDAMRELGLEEVPDEKGGAKSEKKAFSFNRLTHHSFWFGPSKPQERMAVPDFTTPGSAFLMQYPSIDLSLFPVDRDTGQILPQRVSKVIFGVVVEQKEGNEIKVAVKDPSNVHIYDQIAFATDAKYRPILYRADANLIELAQEYIYSLPAGTHGITWFEWLEQKKHEYDEIDVKQDALQASLFAKEDIEGPVIEESNRIIKEAISIGASDIHLETFENEMFVRYRMDGVLHTMNAYPPEMAKALTKRIKITANMDIAMERVPQGGRISVKVADKEFDLRVSLIPVPHGESIVMRLLNKGAFNYKLEDLGYEGDHLVTYKNLLSRPHGMILVSGPTGSGKSTTLYASLKEINRPDRKLLTVEDPIEYEMPGICQVQVNMAPREEEKKVTFAKALREFLRQDPDVILVGEIRDAETAQISVQAALTGHLLLSTIHTNDSVGIVTRLRDMGVAPYLIGSILVGGVAQRLVRKICTKCKEGVEPSIGDKKLFEEHGMELKQSYSGKGCLKCHGVGHKGRLGVYEILEVTPDLGELISTGAHSEEIQRLAVKKGMKLLLHDAMVKAARGDITVDEVRRITVS